MLIRLSAIAVAVAVAAGCAGLKARAVPDPKAAQQPDGFRYYDTSPFLLIHTDGKGGLASKLMYLPDTTKLRTIEPYAYFASNTTTLKFDKGKLIGAKAVVDETVVPAAILSSLEKIAIAGMNAANAGQTAIPAPYLFRIIKVGGEWKLAGGQALDQSNAPARIRYLPDPAQDPRKSDADTLNKPTARRGDAK